MRRSKTQLKTTSKKIEDIVDKVISTFKGIIFKNKDIISGRELVGGGIVSEETESRLLNLKKLRKLNNIYYIWDYNEEFKKLIFSYKYNRKKNLAKFDATSFAKGVATGEIYAVHGYAENVYGE